MIVIYIYLWRLFRSWETIITHVKFTIQYCNELGPKHCELVRFYCTFMYTTFVAHELNCQRRTVIVGLPKKKVTSYFMNFQITQSKKLL